MIFGFGISVFLPFCVGVCRVEWIIRAFGFHFLVTLMSAPLDSFGLFAPFHHPVLLSMPSIPLVVYLFFSFPLPSTSLISSFFLGRSSSSICNPIFFLFFLFLTSPFFLPSSLPPLSSLLPFSHPTVNHTFLHDVRCLRSNVTARGGG